MSRRPCLILVYLRVLTDSRCSYDTMALQPRRVGSRRCPVARSRAPTLVTQTRLKSLKHIRNLCWTGCTIVAYSLDMFVFIFVCFVAIYFVSDDTLLHESVWLRRLRVWRGRTSVLNGLPLCWFIDKLYKFDFKI